MRYCCSFTHFSLAAFSTKGLINLITGLHLVSSPLTRDMKGATRKVSWFGKKTAWGHFSLFLTDNKHASSYLRLDSNALCEVNDSYDYACITLGAKSDSIFPFDLCFAPSGHFKGGIYILQATQDKKIFCILTSITWMQQSWIPVAIILSSLFFIFQPPCHLSSITN